MVFIQEKQKNAPVLVSRRVLQNMDPTSVIIQKWPLPFKTRYFKNLLPDLQIISCKSCFKVISQKLKQKNMIIFYFGLNFNFFQMFHADDYELALLRHGHCPFCRTIS